MGFFRDTNRTGPYFEGWYFKHQNPQGQSLALIRAFRRTLHRFSPGHFKGSGVVAGVPGGTAASLSAVFSGTDWTVLF